MDGRDPRRRRVWLLVAALAVALVVVAAACGGGDEEAAPPPPAEPAEPAPPAEEPATSEPAETGAPSETTEGGAGDAIKLGISSTCEGPFAAVYEATLAGALAPYIAHGATANGPLPSDGITWEVNGHPVEIVFGCSDASPDRALAEAQRLVEQEGVQILHAPLSGAEGIATANYCLEQPDVTFLNGTSGAQDTTLKIQCPNFYRFHTDGAQWMAGLGDYAYNTLGWRRVVTVGDNYDFPWTQTAGFVAEFCSLGGEVVERLWPPLGEEDYTSYIAQIPADIDGFYLSVGGSGTLAFVKQYTQLQGDLADKIIGGSIAIDPSVLTDPDVGPRMIGVVSGVPTNTDSTTPEYTEYVQILQENWGPDVEGSERARVPGRRGPIRGQLGDRRRGNRAGARDRRRRPVGRRRSLPRGADRSRRGGLRIRQRARDPRREPQRDREQLPRRGGLGRGDALGSQNAEDDRRRRPDVRRQLQRRDA